MMDNGFPRTPEHIYDFENPIVSVPLLVCSFFLIFIILSLSWIRTVTYTVWIFMHLLLYTTYFNIDDITVQFILSKGKKSCFFIMIAIKWLKIHGDKNIYFFAILIHRSTHMCWPMLTCFELWEFFELIHFWKDLLPIQVGFIKFTKIIIIISFNKIKTNKKSAICFCLIIFYWIFHYCSFKSFRNVGKTPNKHCASFESMF